MKVDEETVAPDVSLLESMRSVGYSLDAAVADLIDNSISAGATNIKIDLEPTGAEHVAVLDDGSGMSPDVAIEALRLAGSSGTRSNTDLGRFGLGLKTASLSQARKLTVVTKNRHDVTALRWDIDHIKRTGRWSLLRLDRGEIGELFWTEKLLNQETGTLVLWQNLDLLLGDVEDRGQFIRSKTASLIERLSLVFHRYLQRSERAGRVSVEVNGNSVSPIDPFLASNPKTQSTPNQTVRVGGAEVRVKAYTLPHRSGMSPKDLQRRDLTDRMRESQGLYIYRNRRLISWGNWYGLARMDEISKQTRIQVDLPNSIDHLWQLDIKKSRAEPPASFKRELRRLLEGVLEKGRRVHTYRGRKVARSETEHLWSKVRARDGLRYEINLEHPLIKAMLSEMSPASTKRFESMLAMISATYPADDLYSEMAGNVRISEPESSSDSIRQSLVALKNSQSLSLSAEEATSMLSHTEPFNSTPNLTQLIEAVWLEGVSDAD